jgi:hypothetical protein
MYQIKNNNIRLVTLCIFMLSTLTTKSQNYLEPSMEAITNSFTFYRIDTLPLRDNYINGLVDTITLNNITYRMFFGKDSSTLHVQCYEDNKWVTKLKYQVSRFNDVELDHDYNMDGYMDLCKVNDWGTDVYLFKKENNGFVEKPLLLGQYITVLDPKRKIVIDDFDYKWGLEYSKLFIIEADTVKKLFQLDFIPSNKKVEFSLYSSKAYLKGADGKRYIQSPFNKMVDLKNYKSTIIFWKKYYKILLQIKG